MMQARAGAMAYLFEYYRLSGVGPSVMETVSRDVILEVLSLAFSMPVHPADVKFIRYRKVGKGVELEDVAGRLGGILTSVEPHEVEPKALIAFLKKHGAQTFKTEARARLYESLLQELKFDDSEIDPKKHGKPRKPRFLVQSHDQGTIRAPYYFKDKKGAGAYAREIAKKVRATNPDWAWIKITMVRSVPPKSNPYGHAMSQSVLASMYRYKNGKWVHDKGPVKIVGLNESLEESIANTILKQMGGAGRLKAMVGAKHFIDHKNALSFQFPNRKRSKGNYVKVTLRPDDTYDVEFMSITGGGTKVKTIKKYSSIYADQLVSTFEGQTGLRLRL